MRLQYVHQGEAISLDVEPDGDGWRLTLPDGSTRRFEARRSPAGDLEVSLGSRWRRVVAESSGSSVEVAWEGSVYRFEPADASRAAGAAAASGDVTSPMPGVVVDVLVSEGQRVEAYTPLGVVEAMKVMATLEAPFAGTVVEVAASKGQRVAHGEVLFRLSREHETDPNRSD